MNTEVLTKKEAKTQIKKLGVWVKEKAITVGRFFVLENPEDPSVKISPFSVVGNGVDGVGVCFVYYYTGILTDNESLNKVLGFLNFLIPKFLKDEYAIYVRAYGGNHSRFPSVVFKKKSAIVNYDLPGHSFKAAGGEWVVIDGRIMNVKSMRQRTMSPI